MSTTIAALGAALLSLALLAPLAWFDPKRLRSLPRAAAARTVAWSKTRRRQAGLATLLPGLLLALTGNWPAFLIWMGTVLAGSWLLVVLLPGRH